ncbi:MAG: DNA polymerase III subunit delta' [Blastocatellia bacterium]|nr:DNA polymerase III subunit delta' [Blastocatellia bacterium]
MPLRDLIGNARVAKALTRANARDRLPHALLFAGPDGVGKRTFAMELAKAVTCHSPVDGDACGTCDSCVRATSGEHPDIRVFVPEGTLHKIAQMRELAREAQYRPFDDHRRVMIVDDAHKMRDEAANAILKTLEEPPPTTLIVLVTDQPYSLLGTIRSRCQTLRFAPVDAESIEGFLGERFKRPADETKVLSRVAAGRIGRALSTDLSVYRDRRKEMLGLIELLASRGDRLRLMKAAQFLADVGRKDRSELDARLDLFVDLCRDVYGVALGEPSDGVANADVTLRLEALAASTPPERIATWIDAVERLRERLRQNANRQVALEAMLLGLGGE